MTPKLDEARLRELAEAATPVTSWRLSRTRRYVMDGWGAPWVCEVTQRPGWEDTAAFLEAAQPATIVALLDALSAERERGDRAVGLLREMFEEGAGSVDIAMAGNPIAIQDLQGRVFSFLDGD